MNKTILFIFFFLLHTPFFLSTCPELQKNLNTPSDTCLIRWREDSLGCKGYREACLSEIFSLLPRFKNLTEIRETLGRPNEEAPSSDPADSIWNFRYYYEVRCENDSIITDGCLLNVIINDGQEFGVIGMVLCK